MPGRPLPRLEIPRRACARRPVGYDDRADGRIPAPSADDCAPSYRGFAEREIPVDRVWAPDSDDPGSYDDRIEAAGVLHGPDKRAAAERLLALDRFDPRWPVSIVHEHPDSQLLLAP
jgi:hypothetical protein